MTLRNSLKRARDSAQQLIGSKLLRVMSPHSRANLVEHAEDQCILETRTSIAPIRFYTPGRQLIHRACTLLTKEPDTIAWIDGFEPGEVLWDIGANVGTFSLYAAKCRQAQVLAFEPSAINYHVLTRNVSLNDLSGRISTYCMAFCEFTRLGMLHLSSPSAGGALNQFVDFKADNEKQFAATSLNVHGMLGFTIDDFVELFDPPFPNHMKIDVDGIEAQILAGAAKTLRDPRLESLIIELDMDSEAEQQRVNEMLNDAGFHYASTGPIQETPTIRGANFRFERAPSEAALSNPRCTVQ